MNDAAELVDCYVAIWNEADTERRHAVVAELWPEDALDVLQPPQKVLEAAAALDMTAIFRAHDLKELEARVDRACEEFVARGQFSSGRGTTWRASAMSSSSTG